MNLWIKGLIIWAVVTFFIYWAMKNLRETADLINEKKKKKHL